MRTAGARRTASCAIARTMRIPLPAAPRGTAARPSPELLPYEG
ncbi:hypothetical protein RM550_22575 [Streptomyces sp. DSM 41527]|uniref:Uncharacterized protein n=1 Tax=Streptomyces mooreae TaxID=3075523 RepID=A0ABU2TC38_9ACTN|nr:hypothetical protein [Streptomyces sp. DSM 41527]MDT0458484.1 hypothetical protein [Streptomyces sp. DSM 41527]